MATVTKPLALNESLNTTEQTPRNVADVLSDGLENIKQAIEGSGGAGGHEIIDSEGNTMPQESAMQFPDSHVSDDSINGRTVVENVKSVASADYSSETEDGMYLIPDGEGAVIEPASYDKVEVTADGNTTRRDLFNWLFNHCDTSKIRENAYIVYSGNGRIYHYEDINNGTYIFAWESIRATTIEKVCLQLNSSTSTEIDWTLATTGNTKEENYSYKPANGYKYTLYYGNKKATVDLQTTANRCLMSDGVTSVEQALTYSTNEHVVGKWIDGSDLYEKTVSCGALPNATSKQVNHGINNLGTIVEIKGIAIRSSDNASKPLPFSDPTATKIISLETTSSVIYTETGTNYSAYNAWVTLRYTKV